jgi:peptide-methionine (S)-S-oxide reductase
MSASAEIATLAGGCFWCLEAVYLEVDGVLSAESGYTGGEVREPSYEEVCGGETGHAEAVRIAFDPSKVSYADLLEIFFAIHDPTTLDRQGADTGTQYRSAIYCHSPGQEQAARAAIAAAQKEHEDPIVTEVAPAGEFWPAEEHHRNYFAHHPYQPYCLYTVGPKVEKFRRKFGALRRRS